jgi:hypothetical protein
MPSSTEDPSDTSTVAGSALAVKTVHGHVTAGCAAVVNVHVYGLAIVCPVGLLAPLTVAV